MEGRLQLWWLLWALSLLLQHAHCEPSSAELEALLRLGDGMEGFQEQRSTGELPILGWHRSETDYCEWTAVECNTAGRVKTLVLALNSKLVLRQEGLDAMADLAALEELTLRWAVLAPGARLPASWGRLQRLRVVEIEAHSGGPLPGCEWAAPGSFPALQLLALAQGGLTGTLPACWARRGAFPKLQSLSLEGNALSGTLPPQWASGFQALRVLNLGRNLRLGAGSGLPAAWVSTPGAFRRLATLDLDSCALGGTLPEALELPSLSALKLGRCNLTGTLPAAWAGKPSHMLRWITLEQNYLSGTLPAAWLSGGLSLLEYLYLGSNALSSLELLPESPGPPARLRVLALDGNRLSGPLPWATAGRGGSGAAAPASVLEELDLSYNAFTSTLPPHYPALFPSLWRLTLSGNALNGTLPPSWAEGFASLKALHLSSNQLSGPLPLGLLAKPLLGHLSLSSNQLSGTLPPVDSAAHTDEEQDSNLGIALTINLMDNALNGTLPASWAGAQFFQRLRDLNASCNALSGAIPPEWLSASQTVGLDLSRNALAGTIPWRALAAGKALLAVSPGNEGICLPAAALNWGWQKGPCGRGARGATAWGRAQQALCKAQGGQYQPFTQNATSVRLCPESAGIAGRLGWVGAAAAALPLLAALAAGAVLILRRRQRALYSKLSGSTASTEDGLSQPAGALALAAAASLTDSVAQQLEQLLRQQQQLRQGREREAAAGRVAAWVEQSVAALSLRRRHALAGGVELPAVEEPPGVASLRLQDLCFARTPEGQLVLLGEGASAAVFQAELPEAGPVAVKAVLRRGMASVQLAQEAEVLARCAHPCVLEVLGMCCAGELAMLATRLMKRGSLAALLDQPELRWHARGRRVLLEVALGLEYIHTKGGVLHCDIKPSNVLLDRNWHARVADVGLAQPLISSIADGTGAGTILYAAPEQLAGQPCARSADVYSLGLLMLAVVAGREPTRRGVYTEPSESDCPAEVAALIMSCIQAEPSGRPSTLQICELLAQFSSDEGEA